MDFIKSKLFKRLLMSALILFGFLPTCLVSCGNVDKGVSAFNAGVGIEIAYGETTDPQPAALLLIVVPVIMLVLTFIMNNREKIKSLIVSGLSLLELIFVVVFKNTVADYAYKYGCECKSTFTYILYILVTLFLIAIGAMEYFNISPEGGKIDLSKVGSTLGNLASTAKDKVSELNTGVKKEDIVGYCSKCGKPLTKDSAFCSHCGAPVKL